MAVRTGAIGDGLVLFVPSAAGERGHRVLFDGGVERGREDLVGLWWVAAAAAVRRGGGGVGCGGGCFLSCLISCMCLSQVEACDVCVDVISEGRSSFCLEEDDTNKKSFSAATVSDPDS